MSMKTALEVDKPHVSYSVGKKYFPSSSCCKSQKSFLVSGRTLCPLPLHAKTFVPVEFVLILSMLLESFWVHRYINPCVSGQCYFLGLLLPSLPLTTFLTPLAHRFLKLEDRRLIKTSLLVLSTLSFLTVECTVVGLYVNCLLLKEETFLMRHEH